MEPELLQILTGGGSVSVCVGLVLIFLRHLREVNEANQAKTDVAIRSVADRTEQVIAGLTARHAEENRISREAFQDQIESMSNRVFDVITQTSEAVRENAHALTSLEVAVRDLQGRITQG